MKKNLFTREKLITYLLIVSIATITLIGVYFLGLISSSILIKLFGAISAVLIPFVIAFFLSFIIGPIAIWFEKKLRINQTISIILAILLGVFFILGILFISILFVFTQLNTILTSLINLVSNASFEAILLEITEMIGAYLSNNDISIIIEDISNNGASIEKVFALLGSMLITLTGIASSIISVIVVLALTPVFVYYLIKEKTLIFTSISKAAPKSIRHHVVELGKRSDLVIQRYFRGQGIMMTIIFIYFTVALGVLSIFVDGFSIQHAIIFAVLMALFNLVPYLGAWLGLMAPIIFLVSLHLDYQGNGGESSIYLIAILIVIIIHFIEQGLEMSIIQPSVIGRQVHIHPLAVLSSLIFFGGLFGFVGVLLAVPLAGTIRAFLVYFGELEETRKKEEKEEKESGPEAIKIEEPKKKGKFRSKKSE
ncbi:MAG: AI-2E family transporter [Acholeplasmataceae bacterium]|nr:AI-2E family transporter [Acholeplasmataceae bacterium]